MISDDSGVKFFDRKFVAANLRSQLRCPKCDHEYSHRHTAGSGAENFRPFLLPCGHNLCEFCLSKHRQEMDFKCAVCNSSAPPTLNAKNPNSKYPSNIRDYYELNYHVLGEANSLNYYRRYSVDAVNKSLHCTQMSDIVMDIKCSECGHSAAMGECKQCNAFYCKRCFETVHHHSRVLKTHVYLRLDDKKRPSKHIRVGKDIFRMPVPQQCNAHNMPANIYCQGCKSSSCLLCASRYHPNHKTCPVGELNRRYLTEIPATLNVIDAALSDIDGAKLVVKNSKKKLGDFAAETLASISKHFRLMHGQLQNVELQTIEELRESSLSPQMQLNEAMSRLTGYETMLKNLRQMLCPSDGPVDDMQVPQDIWLKEVITLINEHLEKIPSYVNVTKIDSNPYHFTSSRIDLAEILGRHSISKFIDPQIEVRFNNDFDHQSIISSQTSSVTGSGKKYKKQQHGMRYKVNNSHKSGESSSDYEGGVENKEHRFLNTYSAMDITSSSNNKVALVDETLQLNVGSWFKTDALVRVRAVQSPEDFYVQGVHAIQRIREHLEEFLTTPACQPPGIIVVGQQYITCHNLAGADRWHRSLVSQKSEKQDTYHVFLPDIGQTYQVHCSNFRKLSMRIASLPYAAVHCSLKQLGPAKEGTGWEPEACAFLKQMVQNNPVHVTMIRALGSQLYEVDLITKNYDSEISVRESFLYTGLARARPGHGLLMMSQQRLMALQSQIMPKFKIYSGDVLIVQPLHVEHPHEFYVMPHDREKLRQSLQGDLQRVMNHMDLSQLEHIFLGRLQLACVLQSEEQWHRARIEQILPEGYVQVRLVDSGISQKVFWDQLFVLPRQFFSEEIAIKCCLADVETLQENGYTWSNTAISAFKLLISNPKLQMEVISVRDNVALVALQFMRSSNETTNVAAMLVGQGFCLSCGENSKVQTPLVQRSQLDADTRKLIEQTMTPPSQLEPAKLQEIKRSAIEVLHVEHPNEFYVTLSHFMIAIAELRRTVQETAEEMRQNCAPHNNWKSGDLCYVHVRAASEQDTLWHRGQVKNVIPDGETCKYNVHLRDIGELVKNVPYTKLTAMDEVLGPITNSAMPCHLYGIMAKSSAGWSPEAIDFFKSQLQAYSSLHVNGHGRNGDSLAVTLWGSRTEISGPFTPAITKYVSINKKLVHFGWAKRDVQLQQDDNSSVRSLDAENSPVKTDWDHYLLEKIEIDSNNSLCLKIDFQHNDDMPPMELLNDFNIAKPTTGCTEAPAAWLKPRKCNKSLFTSLPTYVNYNCEIFLSLSSDEEYIHYMRDQLGKCFKRLLKNQEKSSYVIGQPVVVSYHLDKQLYRGIVKSNMSAMGEYKVYYVDYGNVESVTPAEMLPFAPFPQLNALCWPVGIYGITPKEDKYSLKAMDSVHKLVVMKLSTIRVVLSKGPNGLPLCQIKVNDVDIATMMVDNDLALRVMPQYEKKPEQPNREKLSTFTMFDELLEFGKINTPSVVSHNNTTVRPPPSKKQFIMDSREHLMCDEEDFDCRDAARPQLKTSVNFEQDDDDNENADEEKSSDGFSDEFVLDEVDEGIANDDGDNNTLSPNPDQASSLPPQSISAMDQIKRRVQLRYKERLDSYNFSPMDSSTERSYHNGFGSLKSQTLPPGVKQFLCIIDKVISATELQISPQLTEFAKQDISLAQETSALIKETAPLHPIVQDALCLARYTKDNQWYRAIVKELNQMAQQATVYYIDFHDTEIVDFSALKAMPKQLFMFPQRSFRVKLHAIKMNRKFGENSVRHSLQACLCKYPMVFARVHYPLDYHNNINESYDSEWDSPDDAMRNGFKLFEVEIYENNVKTELLYKPLIDSRMYLLKKS